MEKVKVFLASSISEFRDLRNEIGDMVRVLQNKLIDEGVVIDLFECEFADNTMVLERMQETYNEEIRKSDIFIMLIGSEIGKYTIEEYEVSREVKDIKRFIFFRGNSNASSIKKFKKDLEHDVNEQIYSNIFNVKKDNEIIDKIEKIILENKKKANIEVDRKVHLFLAAREEDIKNDKHEIGNFIRNLNAIYLDNHIYFDLITDEELEKFNDNTIKNSEMFFIVFGNSISDVTLKEFNLAYNTFKDNNNPKIATFVRKEANHGESVLNFLKKLDSEMGHYYSIYTHPDTIKLNIAMQLNNLGFKKVDLVADNGKIYLEGQEILSTDHIPMFINNEQLVRFKEESKSLDDKYWDLRSKVTIDDNKELASELANVAKRLKEVKEAIAYTEKATLNLSISFVKDEGKGLLTKKQIYARKCLENGLLEEAKSVLNLEDIVSDIKEIEKKSGKEEIKGLIQDLILRAFTYQLDLENKNRIKEIENSYERAIEAEKNNGIPRDTLKLYAEFCYDNKMYEKSASLLEDYYHWAKADNIHLDVSFYLDLAHNCFLAGKIDKSYYYYDILFGLLNEKDNQQLYIKANLQYVDLLLSNMDAKKVLTITKTCIAIGNYIVDHHLLNEDIYKYYYSKSLLQLSITFGDFKHYQKAKFGYLNNSIKWLEDIKDEKIKELEEYRLRVYDEIIHYYLVNNNDIGEMNYLEKEFKILNELVYTKPILYEEKFLNIFKKLKQLYEKYCLYFQLEIGFSKYLKVLNSKVVLSNSNDLEKESMHKFMVDTIIDQHRILSIVAKRDNTLGGYRQSLHQMESLVTELKDMNSEYALGLIDKIQHKVRELKNEYEERKILEEKYEHIKTEVNENIKNGNLESDDNKKLFYYQTALEILENQEIDSLILNDILRVYPKIITIIKDKDDEEGLRCAKRYLNYALLLQKKNEYSYFKHDFDNIVADAYDYVGGSYFRLGSFKKALKNFEEASKILSFLKSVQHEKYGTGDLEYVQCKIIGTLLKLGKQHKADELKHTILEELDRLIKEKPKSDFLKSIKESILNFKNEITISYHVFQKRGEIGLSVVDQFKRPVRKVNITMIDTSDGEEIGTSNTGRDGKINYYNVPENKYQFIVNSFPDGYVFNEREDSVSVYGDRCSYVIFTCEKIMGSLTIKIVDDKNNIMSNVQIRVYDEEGHFCKEGNTDDKGIVHFELDYGKYLVKQYNTLENHCVDDIIYRLEITEQKRNFDDVVLVNQREKGKIAFCIKNKNGKPEKNIKVTIFDQNHKEVKTISTNNNGQAGISNILAGSYFYQIENTNDLIPFEINENNQVIKKEIIL